MTKDAIIKEIAKDPEYQRACKKIAANSYLADELYQEVMLVLLEYPEEKILKIYEEKRIKWFVISILVKMCHSTTSPFFKKIRKFSYLSQAIESNDSHPRAECEPDPVQINELAEIVDMSEKELLNTEDGYEKLLLKLSVEMQSVQKLSQEMNANYLSIWISINNYKKKLKRKYGKV